MAVQAGLCPACSETPEDTFCRVEAHVKYVKETTRNNLNGDPLEIHHPKFENSRLGLIESVHER